MQYLTKERYTAFQNGDTDFDKALAAYRAQLQTYAADLRQTAANLSLHDACVIAMETAGDDLVLHLDISAAFSTAERVAFKGAVVEKDEGVAVGDAWLCEEVYPTKDGFRVLVLFETADGTLKEWRLSAREVLFAENKEMAAAQKKAQELSKARKTATPAQRAAIEKQLRQLHDSMKNLRRQIHCGAHTEKEK